MRQGFITGVLSVGLATAGLTALSSPALAAPSSLSFVTMHSTTGDYVGQSLSQAWYPGNGSVTVSGDATAADIQVSGGTHGKSFTIAIAAPSGQQLAAGTYLNAQRTAFRQAGRPGIDVFGDGRGCNKVAGRFTVDEVLFTEGIGFERLVVSYISRCEESEYSASFGRIVIGRPDAGGDVVAIPDRVDFPEGDVGMASGVATVRYLNRSDASVALETPSLDGADAFAVKSNACGSSLAAGATCSVTVGATPVAAGAQSGALTLQAGGVGVVAELAAEGRSGVSLLDMSGDPGDWITGGERITLGPTNGHTVSGTGSQSQVTIGVNGTSWFNLNFSAGVNDVLAAGRTYTGALRYPFQGNAPGLNVSGDGRGCNSLTGEFTVGEIVFDEVTSKLLSLSARFTQNCEGGVPAARGVVNFRAATPLELGVPETDDPPPSVSGLEHLAQIGGATLAWTIPDVDDFASSVVRIAPGSIAPQTPFDGELVVETTGNVAVVYGLLPGRSYSFTVFSKDASGQYGTGVSVTLVGTDVSLTSSRSVVAPGSSVTLYARIVGASGAAVQGQPVAFLGRAKGAREWQVIATPATSSTGLARLTVEPTTSLEVQAYYYGSDGLLGSTAGPIPVSLGPRATASAADASIRRGQTLTVKGRVAPASATKVSLQRYVSGEWKTVMTRLSRSDGVFSLSRVAGDAGTHKYRVWVAASGPFGAGPSNQVSVAVR